VILWNLRKYKLQKGVLSGLYLIGYALARFIVEFFRQPDEHLGFVVGTFTMGQALSLIMLIIGIVLFFRSTYKKDIK